jgi:hypothetical protein
MVHARVIEQPDAADRRLHDLRRTMGSWQAETGANLSVIGRSLNRKSTQTTAIYARLRMEPDRRSIETAASAILQAAGQHGQADTGSSVAE